MISETSAAYIAGLFDGEGHIQYKQYMRKRSHNKKPYPTWNIKMEMAMTDKSVLLLVQDLLGCGTVNEKRYKTPYTVGWKKQWRWRCQFRDAYYVALLLLPYIHVKREDLNNIIKHYSHLNKEEVKAKVIDITNHKLYKQKQMKKSVTGSLIDYD
jgi:hypothetical protein|tara:strand:- start:256 stop:720 length:465 start_codon:yes stop_codon:yes gene_type:complete